LSLRTVKEETLKAMPHTSPPLDAVCSQVDLAEKIFHEGVSRGFYAKVSRLGTQWLELDLHFLSLGGGETALRWWFEKCLVPYLGDSNELASVKSIDIVTGYGKTRARGMRKGDDSMRKRVRAMLSYMNVSEIVQPNLGRIHIDKQALVEEVARNRGRIIFDAHGYEQFKLKEGLDEPYSDTPQFVRPRGGAMHDRAERDRQEVHQDPSHGCLDSLSDNRDSKQERFVGGGHDKHSLGDESGYGGRDGGDGQNGAASRSFEPPERHSQIPQDNLKYRGSLSWKSPQNDRKRPYDGHNQSRGSDDRNTHPGGSSHSGGSSYGPGNSHDNYSNYPTKRR
jgi:hypothetical protein